MSRAVGAIRPLARRERRAAAHTLALAFDDDPLLVWLLPRAEARLAWLTWLHASVLGEALAVGEALCPVDGPEVGALAFQPPGTFPSSFATRLRATPLPPASWPGVRWAVAGLRVQEHILRVHPTEPHVYVALLGVNPTRQGEGWGRALLERALERADAGGTPAWLETARPANLAFYRRFGFEVTGELASHGGPPLWTMRRAPAPREA